MRDVFFPLSLTTSLVVSYLIVYRNCGLVFCGTCSEKRLPVPEEQLYDPVRVCIACFEKLVTLQERENDRTENKATTLNWRTFQVQELHPSWLPSWWKKLLLLWSRVLTQPCCSENIWFPLLYLKLKFIVGKMTTLHFVEITLSRKF